MTPLFKKLDLKISGTINPYPISTYPSEENIGNPLLLTEDSLKEIASTQVLFFKY